MSFIFGRISSPAAMENAAASLQDTVLNRWNSQYPPQLGDSGILFNVLRYIQVTAITM